MGLVTSFARAIATPTSRAFYIIRLLSSFESAPVLTQYTGQSALPMSQYRFKPHTAVFTFITSILFERISGSLIPLVVGNKSLHV